MTWVAPADRGRDRALQLELAVTSGTSGLGRLRREVRGALRGDASSIVVHLTGTGCLPSGAVAALLRANRCCAHRGGEVVVRAPSSIDLGLLGRTGLRDVIRVECTDAEPTTSRRARAS